MEDLREHITGHDPIEMNLTLCPVISVIYKKLIMEQLNRMHK